MKYAFKNGEVKKIRKNPVSEMQRVCDKTIDMIVEEWDGDYFEAEDFVEDFPPKRGSGMTRTEGEIVAALNARCRAREIALTFFENNGKLIAKKA